MAAEYSYCFGLSSAKAVARARQSSVMPTMSLRWRQMPTPSSTRSISSSDDAATAGGEPAGHATVCALAGCSFAFGVGVIKS